MIELTAGSLLNPLLEASRVQRVNWKEDITGGYLVVFGDNTVNIYRTDREDGATITLRVLNGDNKVVDFIDYSESQSDFGDARQLYTIARRQVLGADKVLEDILGRLNVAT